MEIIFVWILFNSFYVKCKMDYTETSESSGFSAVREVCGHFVLFSRSGDRN